MLVGITPNFSKVQTILEVSWNWFMLPKVFNVSCLLESQNEQGIADGALEYEKLLMSTY